MVQAGFHTSRLSRRSSSRQVPAALAAVALLGAGLVAIPAASPASAAPPVYRLVGSLQDEIGCTADWAPDCLSGELAASTVEGLFAGEFSVPAGTYEFKVLAGDTWADQAWGRAGATGPDASNIRLTVAGTTALTFVFDETTGRTSIVPVRSEERRVGKECPV